MNIFASGIQRGGTTMLRRILHAHPDVFGMLHETHLLDHKGMTENEVVEKAKMLFTNPKYEAYRVLKKSDSWGEKIPYFTSVPKKEINYWRRWQSVFGYKSKVVHIVRHPYDVAISTQRRFKTNPKKTMMVYGKTVSSMIRFGYNNPEWVLSVKFEDIVTHPQKMLGAIYDFCELDSSDQIIDGICSMGESGFRYHDGFNADRVFSYKKEGLAFKTDQLMEVLPMLNSLGDQEYEL